MKQLKLLKGPLAVISNPLIKVYFSISKTEQQRRFKDIISSPIKKWKFSDVDRKALALWDE